MSPSGSSVAVIVPLHATDDWREQAWQMVSRQLSDHQWPVVVGWAGSKAATVNLLVRTAQPADVLVIHDADSLVDAEALEEAVSLVRAGAPWVVPHHLVYRLGKRSTRSWLEGDRTQRAIVRSLYQGPAGGGVLVLSRAAFEEVRGFDERFVSWGWEDQAMGRALATLVGPYRRLSSDLIHLWHPPAAEGGRPDQAMTELWRRYKAASYCPRLMRALVDRCEPAPWVELEQPRTFRSETPRRAIRYGKKSAYFSQGELTTTDPDLADAMGCYEYVHEV